MYDRVHSERAVRLMDMLGLSEDELCETLGVDPLTLLSGQLDHRPELPILLTLLDEASEKVAPAALRRWVRTSGPAGTPIDALTGRDFGAFEDQLAELERRGFVVRRRGGARRMGEPFVHRLRVRYAECDPQGVLFNAQYLAYVDHTVTELWRAAYGGYERMLERGVDIVVAEAQMRFLRSARFDQEVDAEMLVTHLGTTSLRSHHRLVDPADDVVLMEADTRHVWVDRQTGVKTPIPDWARAGLEPWYAPEA